MRILLGLVTVLVGLGVSPALAQKRVALVIGNGAYASVAQLLNPVRDAEAMAALFTRAGFDVVEARRDLNLGTMRRALRDFSDRVRGADVAVVFYAGHGIEVNGTNYLIPTDAVLERDIDVEDEAVSLDRVSQLIEPAKRLRLIILDACRDNPFAPSMKRTMASRSIGRGLGRVEVTTADTMIAFAAKAGSIAADGSSANSPYTTALLKHLATPGLDVRLALGRVRDDVLAATTGRQEPFVYGSLGGEAVTLVGAPSAIVPSQPSTAPATPADPDAAVRADYQLAERAGTREAWEAFLARHPGGYFADLARVQLRKLVVLVPATPSAPAQPNLHRALRGREVWVSWNDKGEAIAQRVIARLEELGMTVLKDKKDHPRGWNHDLDHSPEDAALAREVAVAVQNIYSFTPKSSSGRSIPSLWITP